MIAILRNEYGQFSAGPDNSSGFMNIAKQENSTFQAEVEQALKEAAPYFDFYVSMSRSQANTAIARDRMTDGDSDSLPPDTCREKMEEARNKIVEILKKVPGLSDSQIDSIIAEKLKEIDPPRASLNPTIVNYDNIGWYEWMNSINKKYNR